MSIAGQAVRREAWPALLVPVVIFAVWLAYVIMRAGGMLGTSASKAPFFTWGQAWGSFNVVYLLLTAVCDAASLTSVLFLLVV